MPLSPLIRRPGLLDGRDGKDLSFSSVELLLPMSSTNGNTSILDKSKNLLTVTLYGNAQISTAQSPFAEKGSGYFDGSSSYLSVSSTQLSTADFTIEGWFYQTSQPTYSTLFSLGSYTDGILFRKQTQGLDNFYIAGSSNSFNQGYLPLNAWNHLAVVRASGSVNVFFNGSSGFQVSNGSAINPAANLFVANAVHAPTNHYFPGYISNFRITKGIARYTANFTPPSRPFPTV